MQFAKLISPSSFMPMLGTSYMNVPGTSYWSAASGGNSIFAGGNAAYNFGELGSYQGLPTGGAASMLMGFGSSLSSLMGGFSMDGQITGGAASMVGPSLNTAGAMMGMGSGYTGSGESILLPAAGIISGFGGILSAMGPYMGPFGLGATVAGNLAQGYGGATLAAYQSASGQILNNADTILTNKVKNIETVVKQLGAQSDVIKKMLKDNVEGDSKAVQNM
jgi:hypothetical protein